MYNVVSSFFDTINSTSLLCCFLTFPEQMQDHAYIIPGYFQILCS